MRLIDSDMLKKYMMDNGKETERFLRCIDEQPTAYDTNKVIEELKDSAIEFEAFGICSDYVELTTAIDIVKGGVRPGGNVSSTPWISVSERLPEDIDRRYFMCLVENHLEDPPMFCQYEEEYGFGFWKDIYDPVTLGFLDSEFETMEELGYEKVLYWMPMIEPPEESEE